jgi:hypothetical protein
VKLTSTKIVICYTGLGKDYRGSDRCNYIGTFAHRGSDRCNYIGTFAHRGSDRCNYISTFAHRGSDRCNYIGTFARSFYRGRILNLIFWICL